MPNNSGLYGLVMSGGKSIRMGCDKSVLVYHKKPQRYHVYDMLATFCEKVFISCNTAQLPEIDYKYSAMADQPAFKKSGPMAALLTAFANHPGKDLVVVGCDYPFVKTQDVIKFLSSIEPKKMTAAFYNYEHHAYEPLLAWYSSKTATLLYQSFNARNFSLENFMERTKAQKYFPPHASTIMSIDSPHAFNAARHFLKRK